MHGCSGWGLPGSLFCAFSGWGGEGRRLLLLVSWLSHPGVRAQVCNTQHPVSDSVILKWNHGNPQRSFQGHKMGSAEEKSGAIRCSIQTHTADVQWEIAFFCYNAKNSSCTMKLPRSGNTCIFVQVGGFGWNWSATCCRRSPLLGKWENIFLPLSLELFHQQFLALYREISWLCAGNSFFFFLKFWFLL